MPNASPLGVMASWLRLLIWIAVVVLPGGILLLPVLLADAVRRRQAGNQPA